MLILLMIQEVSISFDVAVCNPEIRYGFLSIRFKAECENTYKKCTISNKGRLIKHYLTRCAKHISVCLKHNVFVIIHFVQAFYLSTKTTQFLFVSFDKIVPPINKDTLHKMQVSLQKKERKHERE